jgi:hypothetical protein
MTERWTGEIDQQQRAAGYREHPRGRSIHEHVSGYARIRVCSQIEMSWPRNATYEAALGEAKAEPVRVGTRRKSAAIARRRRA